MRKYDVVIIGAGPGGYVAAIRSAQLGFKTAIIEKEYMGGVCLNIGCVPSKALISAAHFFHKLTGSDAQAMGIQVKGTTSIDMKKLQLWKTSICQRMSKGVLSLLKGNGVEVIHGEASFTSPQQIQVTLSTDSTKQIEAKYFIVATGSRSTPLSGFAFDEKNILSSTGALALQEIPKKVIVVGGGYIGLEIAGYFCHLGSQVTVLEASSQILSGMADDDILQVIEKHLKKIGITILKNTKAHSWDDQGKTLSVTIESTEKKQNLLADKVMVAIGRKPNSDQMNLKDIGLLLDQNGFIQVNAQRRTNIPHIFAIGDIAGQPMLAHKASYEGILVAEVLAGQNRTFDVKVIPSVVFTHPEFSSVGLNEAECKAQGLPFKVSRFPFTANARAFCFQEPEGFVKVIFHADNQLVLGVHIVGPDASHLISEAALAIEMGATLEDIAYTIHPHPTLSETLAESCATALGHPIHVL